jgi:hypothetical protein
VRTVRRDLDLLNARVDVPPADPVAPAAPDRGGPAAPG